MSNTALIITITSVFAGFACFTGSFLSFMYKKPKVLTWGLMVAAIILITLIPTTIGVFWATLGAD
ncbi:hypothetical protein C1Y63_07990 [Corynebacterium sp. 13CS0277]|uniref:hypothetical protein n=1 Tax=Corynebacterium sp. 13CS0277 TaxID=2071994 RepID=UPI000D03E427|nr:hypothetical protein [Corynebacterium sp. 13CS0277]PRQ11061.1 hypothetical protein C1Y63_07990 [Corynebacterium sp. 13CS0277]